MKNITRIFLSLAILSILTGCAGSGSSESERPAVADTESEAEEFDRSTPPKLGMSRSRVRALYGEPKFTSSSPRGEVWNYSFDSWKFRIPYYNLGAKLKTGTVTFDASGKVVDYHWGQSRSAFMMGM